MPHVEVMMTDSVAHKDCLAAEIMLTSLNHREKVRREVHSE